MAAGIFGMSAIVLLVAYVAVAAFVFCQLDTNNHIRRAFMVRETPERVLRLAALTWPFWVWRKEESDW